MTELTVNEAVRYCRENNIRPDQWSCGYALEVTLELEFNIKLIGEDAWVNLENQLYYNR